MNNKIFDWLKKQNNSGENAKLLIEPFKVITEKPVGNNI
jgi:hypothetical protein